MLVLLLKKFNTLVKQSLWLSPERAWQNSWPYRDGYISEDNTLVTIYTVHPKNFTNYEPVKSLLNTPGKRRVTVSLIAAGCNEGATARQLVNSLLRQTRRPDEIVLCDTGSQDSAANLLRELAAASPIPMRVVKANDANIARGRNAAITQAQGQVIAVTDFGYEPEPTWLENLIAPFELDPAMQVTFGRVRAVDARGQPARWWTEGVAETTVNPQTVLPPGASVAFTRTAWQSVGGYPEWLATSAADTYLTLELKRITHTWAFVPEAVVNWGAPNSIAACARAAYTYGVGQGEIGLEAQVQRRVLFLSLGLLISTLLLLASILAGAMGMTLLAALLTSAWGGLIYRRWRPANSSLLRRLVFALTVNLAWSWGYWNGARRQPLAGVWFVLSYVPLDDTGGGARGAQLVLELLRRRFLVVYLHRIPERATPGVEINHPNLITYCWPNFAIDPLIKRYSHLPAYVLVEVPWTEHVPILKRLREAGMRVVYDLIDDWHTPSLGGDWFTAPAEREIIAHTDALVATAPVLQQYLEQLSGRKAALLPNAVNLNLFNYWRAYPCPADLPPAKWTIVYAGALWGDWFDWELLVQIARCYPDASVVAMGEYAGQCPTALPNLHFLGLKPQKSLPAYLAHTDVAIIPWLVNAATLATSPLKLYEYLAMRKPVVVPNLPLLRDLPLVLCSTDPADFVRNVERARGLPADEQALADFLSGNSWPARVSQLLQLTGA